MLQSLHVENLALIERAELELVAGLNVISGETGGGKSLIIAALKLLRGERGTAGLVRHGAQELRVEGLFRLGASDRSGAILELLHDQLGAECEDGQLVVVRTLDSGGRSKVRINGHLATLPLLRELGEYLLEIHGQGETRSLMRPEVQAEILDSFAGTSALREQYAGARADALRFRLQLDEATANERRQSQRCAELEQTVADLEGLGIVEGELESLARERNVLANADHMRSLLQETLADLHEAEPSAQDLLGRCARRLAELAALDQRLVPDAERLAAVARDVQEIVRDTQSGLARLELDPGRLEQVELRLATVKRALGRHGPAESDLLRALAEARAELAQLQDSAGATARIEAELAASREQAGKLARRLVKARLKAATLFTAAVEAELKDLGMKGTTLHVRCEPEFTDEDVLVTGTRHGPTPLDFWVCINPGEPERKLAETASGGEMARLVIALKKCLADQDRVPFLVFDEVDSEIGGRLGLAVGKKLREVSQHHQVLIVTHLPQVAAFADAHFKVSKAASGDRTRSVVARLEQREVERELAAMTIGEGADANALGEAKRLVERARGV